MKKLFVLIFSVAAVNAYAVESDFRKLVDRHMTPLNETYVVNSVREGFADYVKSNPFGVYSELKQDGRTFTIVVAKKKYACVELPVSIHKGFPSIGYISVSCELPPNYLSIVLDAYEFKRGRFTVVRSDIWETAIPRRIPASLFNTNLNRVCGNEPTRARRTMCFLGTTTALPNVGITASLNVEAAPDQSNFGISTKTATYQKDLAIAYNRKSTLQGAVPDRAVALTRYQKSACHISRRICKLALP